jgi:hypothetical protein
MLRQRIICARTIRSSLVPDGLQALPLSLRLMQRLGHRSNTTTPRATTIHPNLVVPRRCPFTRCGTRITFAGRGVRRAARPPSPKGILANSSWSLRGFSDVPHGVSPDAPLTVATLLKQSAGNPHVRVYRRLQAAYCELVQQPGGGDTPGVAEAPVALAGAIMVGLVRSIEMLSLQAAVFGVGMTAGAGLMLVSLVSRSAVGD